MSTDQILFGVGLTLVLAVGSQVLASRLRIPALIVLLPVGFVAGALTDTINPNRLLGSLFEPLVSLSVAVILFDSGLGLDLRKLRGHTRRVVRRLIVLGTPVTWAFAASAAALLLGMSTRSAIVLGAILVVSGPTVVGPLLSLVRPSERVQRVLVWEGSLIDPVGAILGALAFHAVTATHRGSVAHGVGQFLASVGVGLAGFTGMLLLSSALVSATRRWIQQLEQPPGQMAKLKWRQARAAASAGAQAWRSSLPDESSSSSVLASADSGR